MPKLEDLGRLMTARTRLVCVTHASNLLGSINPIRAIADFVHERGALICVDGVAYAPHRAIDVQELDVDYYVFSFYKTFGPHYAVMYGRHDLLLDLDGLYHYFYGKEKVLGKLEPGNPCYEPSGVQPALSTMSRRWAAGLGARPSNRHLTTSQPMRPRSASACCPGCAPERRAHIRASERRRSTARAHHQLHHRRPRLSIDRRFTRPGRRS